MKPRRVLPLLSLALALATPALARFDAESMAAQARKESVLEQVREKAAKGPLTANDLLEQLMALDEYAAEFEEHKEHAADFIYTKGMIYAQVLGDYDQAREVFLSIQRDYPDTFSAKEVKRTLPFLERAAKRFAAKAEYAPIVERIQSKADAGAKTPDAFAEEIKQLDRLVAKYANNAEAAAQIASYKAVIYVQVVGDTAKGRELLQALINTYPDTLAARAAKEMLDELP